MQVVRLFGAYPDRQFQSDGKTWLQSGPLVCEIAVIVSGVSPVPVTLKFTV